ncbi:MAG TPA: ribonuclease III, partial [Acidimicrobiales bacterium]
MLLRALTHRSWCAENPGYLSNERLEYLGDSVLGVIVTDEVFHRFPDAGEGRMSRARAAVVCAPALAEMAAEIDLGAALLLGKGEASSGGRDRPSILADGMEAVIGAVYLDAGLPAARKLVLGLLADRLVDADGQDAKSRLHELVARGHDNQISYEISEAGPEHDKQFRAVLYLNG